MRIAVISDCHLGYGYNTALENDSFENFDEAMSIALEKNSDLIILGGDIFDSRMPRTTVWAKAMKILTKPLFYKSDAKLVSGDKFLKKISKRILERIPVIALHGNHERRIRGELNVIEALENAGLVIHLHKNNVVFEKDGIRVAIHGMSNVPERYAKDNLKEWNPKPIKDCFNILILHQSISPFVFSPLEPPSLSLKDLPDGFELILDGHVHTYSAEKINGTGFYIIGSTIPTQLEEKESLVEKGLLIIDLNKNVNVEFVHLKNCRKFIYDKIIINPNLPAVSQLESRLSEIIYKHVHKKPPLIKLKIFGEEGTITENDLRALEKKYNGKAILIFSKELESKEVKEKTELLRSFIEKRQSIEEMGLSLLRENLNELKFDLNFDFEDLFHLLLDGDVEKAFNILTGEQKTLTTWFK
jgi:DNA repair exonuclease SbcCD nuclease subunit